MEPELIRFLAGFKYLAVVLVAVSAAAFGLLAFSAVMFCDVGPVSTCFRWAAFILGIPMVQIVSLVMAWSFLKKRHYIRTSAGLMILSVLPMLLGVVWLILSRYRR